MDSPVAKPHTVSPEQQISPPMENKKNGASKKNYSNENEVVLVQGITDRLIGP